MTSRLHRAADAISQLFNVIIFDGDGNYSISGDAHRLGRVRLKRVINGIFFFENDHCLQSYMNDVYKAEKLVEEHKSMTRDSRIYEVIV
jgi:hypothetical protein